MSTTIKPGDHGPAVAELAQSLAERGILPPTATAEVAAEAYGPTLQGAVATFQAQHGLVVDSIVGPRTWAALQGAEDAVAAVPAPDYEHMTPRAAAIIRAAMGEFARGVREIPAGSNRGPAVDQYLRGQHQDGVAMLCYHRFCGVACSFCDGKPEPTPQCKGSPWCGRFALWCVVEGCRVLGAPTPTQGWGGLASAWKWNTKAREHGAWRPEPVLGGVGLIVPGPQAHGHVVLVTNLLGEHVGTVEGNCASAVARRVRAVSEFTGGFVQIG